MPCRASSWHPTPSTLQRSWRREPALDADSPATNIYPRVLLQELFTNARPAAGAAAGPEPLPPLGI
jgi:hypothetical protein